MPLFDLFRRREGCTGVFDDRSCTGVFDDRIRDENCCAVAEANPGSAGKRSKPTPPGDRRRCKR
jgi:hypothetical protein